MKRLLAVLVLLAACEDPVHDGWVDALGPEQGSTGPTHRPGQPCLACHGGSGPGKQQFAFGGTVYKEDKEDGFPGVDVQLTDASGAVRHVTTNEVGNFYLSHDDWEPIYPVHVSISIQDVKADMGTHIGRDGSCASCHFEPKGPSSAGHVQLSEPQPDTDGGP
jgi:hypothetical protein